MPVRLQRYLAQCSVGSRRLCDTLIAEGRITVNGRSAEVGESIEPGVDEVLVDGRRVMQSHDVYIVLNKPAGVVTTAKDTHGRRTVLDCVGGVDARVFPVGRLDQDVEGVLLLTNDGELAHRLMHPRYAVDKVYLAWVAGNMAPETAVRMELGVDLEDGMARPERVVILHRGARSTEVEIVMREGRKREVKRLCEAVGHRVLQLQRIAIGSIRARGLRPGEWRHLTEQEIRGLRKLVGLDT